MKQILIVINALDGGGAEKSLISLLNELERYKNVYNIDLLIPYKKGLFYDQIPSFVNEIKIPKGLHYMAYSFSKLVKQMSIRPDYLLKKLLWQKKRILLKGCTSGVLEQQLWKLWKNKIPKLNKEYDIAISYLNGYTNYYVIDKVLAKKKILWIHNDYQKLGYELEFDRYYYKKATYIITISKNCTLSFIEKFPEFRNKIKVLENLSSGQLIHRMANDKIEDNHFFFCQGLKILSIGRLVEQKNFQLAIETAAYIKRNYPQLNYKWFIMGKGPLYRELQNLIKYYSIEENVTLLGAKENPYPYIAKADIIVQTSIYEGKSIVLDEAKLLGKIIISTNYDTVYDSIENTKTGLIVEMKANAVAKAIIQVAENENFSSKIKENLRVFANGNVGEVKKYLELFDEEFKA